MEPEFYSMLPSDFTVHTGRLRLREVTVEDLTQMEKKIEEEALKLKDAGVEVIGYGCTSGSLFRGRDHDKEIEARIEKCSRIPAVATAGAVVKALSFLEARRVAVATPYIEEVNSLERAYLDQSGLQVVDLKGLGIKSNYEIGKLKPEMAYKLVKELRYKETDAIFISCTNFSTLNVIKKLEAETKKPVVSSNTATLWAMIKRCGISLKVEGAGRLLEESLNEFCKPD
jgi:maleate isomerase